MQLKLVENNPQNDEAPSFEAFWLLYPRRVAKKDALKAWNRIDPANQAAALDALVDWRRIFANRDEEKIPHAATWLNGERWTDELPRDYRGPTSAETAARRDTEQADNTIRIRMPQRVRDLIAGLRAKKS